MPWKLLSFLSDFSHIITNLWAKHCWHREMIYWLLDAFNSFLIKIYDTCQAYDSLVWTALLSTTWTNSQILEWEVSVETFLNIYIFFLSWSKLHIYFTCSDITGHISFSLFQCIFAILPAVSEWTVRLKFWRVFMESGVSARLLMRGIIMSCLFTHPVRMH